MFRILCSSIVLVLLLHSLSIAETQENYLATFQEIEEEKRLCETFPIDEDLYDAFFLQVTKPNIQVSSLERPWGGSETEIDLYDNISSSSLWFMIAQLGWNNAIILTGIEDQDTIDGYISDAEQARATAILYLDGAWESYNKMDFDGDNDGGGDGGGGGGGGGCFIDMTIPF
jgi:hypothetical protein